MTTDPTFPTPINGRIHVDEAGMRFESERGDYSSIYILDLARNVSILLQPHDRTYIEFTLPEESMGLGDWRMQSEGDPCGAFMDESVAAEILGLETLRGRRVEKWRCAAVGDEEGKRSFTLWRDPSLPLAFVRLEGDDGMIVTLHNIITGPQPAELFEVPPGYTKRELMEGTVFQTPPSDGIVIQVLPD